ncbi:putative RNA-directed DNA polymerase [Helianthus annuus]|nr:putative RNA-directed DNA polymerase [Helianthus annuus]
MDATCNQMTRVNTSLDTKFRGVTQSVTARSSAEAEYRSMCDAACEVMWLVNVLRELYVDIQYPVDNTAALSIAVNPVFHDKTKHFELDLFFLREKIAAGIIKTVGVESAVQLADVFTKGLLPSQHENMCKWLGLVNLFQI